MRITFQLLLLFFTFSAIAQPRVVLHSIEGYGSHVNLANRAANALEKVLRSEEFKQAILSGKFEETNGYDNETLYNTIMLAHEVQGEGGQDNVVDLRVRTLRINEDEANWRKNCEIGSRSGTLGIDGNGTGVTAICPQRLELWAKQDNVSQLAGHYAHEYMHILGFGHRKEGFLRIFERQRWRQKTFVYKIGNLVAELVLEAGINNN